MKVVRRGWIYFLSREKGSVADTDLLITLEDEDAEENFTVDARTNDGGFFTADFEIPDEADRLSLDIETDDGENVEGPRSNIRVSPAPTPEDDDDDEPVDFIDLSFSIEEFRTAPGDEMTAVLEAKEGDEPIANEEIDVLFRYGFGADGAPLFSGTVVTDEDGIVEETVAVPENAPDGERISATALFEFEGETYEATTGVNVEEIDVSFTAEDDGDVSVEAVDRTTDEPVEGFPFAFDEHYSGVTTGSYATGSVVTDEDGLAETSFEVPDDRSFEALNNYVDRYTSTNVRRIVAIDYPGTLDVGQETAEPGEEVDVEFDVPDDVEATGVAFGRTTSPTTSFAGELTTEDGGTVTVPEIAQDGDSLRVTVWAVGDDGQLYQDRQFGAISVETADETTAEFTVDPEEPFDGQEVTFDASASTSAEGELTYEWTFGDGEEVETDDAVTTHVFDDSGEYEVELTVTDENGTSDTATQTVTVVEEPEVNAVFAIDPETPEANETVTFDASDSTAQAEIDEYVWEFGDGTTNTTSDPVTTHTYEEDGEYEVKLTVIDVDGNEGNSTQTLDVTPDEEFLEEDGAGFSAAVAVFAVLMSVLLYRRR